MTFTAIDEDAPSASDNPKQSRASLQLILLLAALLCACVYFATPKDGVTLSDADSYYRMALGQTDQVVKPFAYRFLAPWLVYTLHHALSLSIEIGFRIISLASLFVMVAGILEIIGIEWRTIGFAAAIVPLALWLNMYHDYYLPDLFHAALLVIMLSFLRRNWLIAAALLMPVLYLARESTLLVAIVLIPVLYLQYKARIAAIFAGTTFAGMVLSKYFARHALPNIHGMNDLSYMIGKVPWNTAKTLLGIETWTNTEATCAPLKTWNLPFHLGNIHAVGYCGFNWHELPLVICAWLTTFGIAPIVCFYLVRHTPWQSFPGSEKVLLRFCLIYGCIAFLLAPVLGTDYPRLMGYGWPAFLLFTVIILKRFWNGSGATAVFLLSLQLLASYSHLLSHDDLWLYLFLAIGPSIACWILLSKTNVFQQATTRLTTS